ncbi:MAG: sigma-70 family RNA polymerase sigma factor [Planctomycetota bacterium]
MSRKGTQTSQCLQQWNGGDEKGLDTLIECHLPWIRNHVRKRLGTFLKNKAETEDYVHDAMIQFLQYGPHILISDDNHFRALMVRIVENTIRNRNDWYMARRRKVAAERPIPSDTVLYLDPPKNETIETPSRCMEAHEREAWVRLALEFLTAEDREVIVLRQWDDLSFVEIGKQLGLSTDAAWMRHKRALNRMADVIWKLRRGQIENLLVQAAE